ncbi:unnamed protein product, partial [Discosporangium mesarthrocarpum]
VSPDVVVTDFEALNDRIDDGTRVRFTLHNQGSGVARNFNVDIVHSDDATIGNADDHVRLTVFVAELGVGESVTLFADVDFDVRTLVERFISENENTGNPGEDAMSAMVDHLAAVVSGDNFSQQINHPTDDVTALPFDVNRDGAVTPRDALRAISAIGGFVDFPSRYSRGDSESLVFDTDRDQRITPLDATTVMGHIGLSAN